MVETPQIENRGSASLGASPQSFSLTAYLVNHFLLAVLLLIVSHYIMIFFVDTARSVMNLVFMAIVFPFGYDNFFRTKYGLGLSLLFGLGIAIVAVMGMSLILWLILNEPFFPAPRARQDLTESTVAIMLSYGCGAALGKFVYQVAPKETQNSLSLTTTLRTILSWIGPGGSDTTVRYIKAVEMVIRAIEVLVVAIIALVFAIRGFFH